MVHTSMGREGEVMSIKSLLVALVVSLSLAAPVLAGPFEDGLAARERGDLVQASKWYRKAAEQGHTEAQYEIGYRYSMGLGVPRDVVEAAKWYRKAAEQGHTEAQYTIGRRYHRGKPGVLQDYVQAAKWYREAAEKGYALSQEGLGILYYKGQGVPQDYVEAHKWFNLAVASGNASAAALRRSDAAQKMTPAQIAEAQRLAREWKPKK